nr:unnamed protein product [Callosobruchus chinensis]
MGLLTNTRLAERWISYANVVKFTLACFVRLCSWPCNSSVKCAKLFLADGRLFSGKKMCLSKSQL